MEFTNINPEIMDSNTERWLFKRQAEDFLEQMGYIPTPKLVRRFVAYLIHFDKCNTEKASCI